MRNLLFFSKKELLEAWRTKKFLILLLAFAAFGIMSPLFAKLMPEILQQGLTGGIKIELPKPTSVDSWTQFYKNISQMGIYLVVIMFSGIVSHEVSQGTLINLVTKGLPREVIILSKSCVMVLQWTVVLLCSFVITFGYTWYYFPDQKSPHLLAALFPLWLFGVLLLSIVLLMSTLFNSSYGSLLGTVIVMVILYGANLFHQIKHWNPLALISENLAILQGKAQLVTYLPAIGLSIATSILAICLAIFLLKKKKL